MSYRSNLPAWVWSRENPDQDGAAGDITRLFKANRIEQPGVLGRTPPDEIATLFAREAIQNSWDAARELRKQAPGSASGPFVLDFVFRECAGSSKREMRDVLGLGALAERVSQVDADDRDPRQLLGLFNEDCLAELEGSEPLSLLYMHERGAIGMYGNWDNSESRMMCALIRIGYTEKGPGAGGSFGYGKAGLVQASKIRAVFAYSCFQEHESDPGITRRLLGVTYWGKHTADGQHFTGWVRYGKALGGAVRPLENEEADRVAVALGFDLRSPDVPEQLGTSFLIVDPAVSPVALCRAVERHWWPAIKEADGLRARIRTADGETEYCKAPVHDPDLGPFIKAYEWATTSKENTNPEIWRGSIGGYNPQSSEHRFACLGKLGLVADADGWSYPPHEFIDGADEENGETHKTIVALIRGPRMIVQYWTPPSNSPPYVRGVFVADDSVDDLLRMTEPPNHDRWVKGVTDAGIDPVAGKVAGEVLKKIKESLYRFRRQFTPPPPPPGPVHLPELDKLMRILTGGRVKPPEGDRTLSITYPRGPEPSFYADNTVSVTGEARICLPERLAVDAAEVEVALSLAFLEDSRSGELCELAIQAPPGFVPQEARGLRYRFRGKLEKGKNVSFRFESARYSADWTTKMAIVGDLVKP